MSRRRRYRKDQSPLLRGLATQRTSSRLAGSKFAPTWCLPSGAECRCSRPVCGDTSNQTCPQQQQQQHSIAIRVFAFGQLEYISVSFPHTQSPIFGHVREWFWRKPTESARALARSSSRVGPRTLSAHVSHSVKIVQIERWTLLPDGGRRFGRARPANLLPEFERTFERPCLSVRRARPRTVNLQSLSKRLIQKIRCLGRSSSRSSL